MYIKHAVSQPDVIHELPSCTVGHEDDVQHPYDGIDGMGWCDANVEGMEVVNDGNVGEAEEVNGTTAGVEEVKGTAAEEEVKGTIGVEEGNQNGNEDEEVEKGEDDMEGNEYEDSAMKHKFDDSDDEEGDEGYFDDVGVAASIGDILGDDIEEMENAQVENENEHNAEVENRVQNEDNGENGQRVEDGQRVEAEKNGENGKKRKTITEGEGEGSGSTEDYC
ncbi:hypothetical protein RIF29_33739 [Crotalaria pallida]|uniref:Uncharacterized protein n=1 Tax=Crotalaria pallida TaxID=3830 RepID=A0AAN9E855_CROPI